jgi:hypothetical protein
MEELRVVYHFPGRLRVRAAALRTRPEIAAQVSARLDGEPGVISHQHAPVTGSLLIAYDAHQLQLPRLVRAILDAGGFTGLQVDVPALDLPTTPAGARLRRTLDRGNRKLMALTHDGADLRTLGPGVLAGLGLAKLAFGNRRLPEWYDLLFWSFVTFVNLNPPAPAAIDRAPSPAAPRGDDDEDVDAADA